MKKHITQRVMRFLFLIAVALSSSCGQSIVTDSTSLISSPTETNSAPGSIYSNGTLIYFDRNDIIYLLDLQNREVKNFITAGEIYDPVIDSEVIYFLQRPHIGNAEQPLQIFKVKFDGTAKEQMTFDGSEKSGLNSSVDSEYLVYIETGELSSVVLLDKNTNETKAIIQDGKSEFHNPSWSPDGKKIAFFRTIRDDPKGSIAYPVGDLLLYSLDEESIIDLIPEIETVVTKVLWSPNGKSMAINVGDSLNSGVYILNMETTTLDKVVEGKFFYGFGYHFKWSPDSNRILFRTVENFDEQLLLFDLHSKKVVSIKSEEKEAAVSNVLWAPDGNSIAYVTSSGEPSNPSILNIQNLDTNENVQFEIPGSVAISFLSWISQ